MTEQDTAEVASPELPIDFNGREIWVRMPSPEQLLVWKRTLKQLQEIQNGSWTGDLVMRALERTRLIIGSVLVNKVDEDWLDDEMLEGKLGLMDTAQIINKTAEAFADAAEQEGNRSTKRAAKKTTPAKKATRKVNR